jgi:hypothetical protein
MHRKLSPRPKPTKAAAASVRVTRLRSFCPVTRNSLSTSVVGETAGEQAWGVDMGQQHVLTGTTTAFAKLKQAHLNIKEVLSILLRFNPMVSAQSHRVEGNG